MLYSASMGLHHRCIECSSYILILRNLLQALVPERIQYVVLRQCLKIIFCASGSCSSLKRGGWQGCATKYVISSRLGRVPACGAAASSMITAVPGLRSSTKPARILPIRRSGITIITVSAVAAHPLVRQTNPVSSLSLFAPLLSHFNGQ